MPTLTLLRRPGLGDLARRGRNVEQLLRGDVDVLAELVELVGPVAEHRVEDRPAGLDHARVRDPRAVEAVAGLARSCRRVTFANACSFTAGSLLGMNAAIPPIACAPRLWQVRTSSSVYARMNGTVIVTLLRSGSRKSAPRVRKRLDHAEHVVPAAGVQPGGVLPQLVEDLLHLERGRVGLDQHGRPDRAARDAQVVLRGRRTRRSRAAPRGATPSSAGRSTVPGRGRAAADRRRRGRARSRPATRTPARRRPGCASPAGASRAAGRRSSPAPRPASARTTWRRCVKSICRVIASSRLSWPPITFSHSGVFASSWSASHTLAPEFSALIVIFRSVGPVISTRRSTSPGAAGATRQSGSSRDVLGLRQEVQRRSARDLGAPAPGDARAVPAAARRTPGATSRSARERAR